MLVATRAYECLAQRHPGLCLGTRPLVLRHPPAYRLFTNPAGTGMPYRRSDGEPGGGGRRREKTEAAASVYRTAVPRDHYLAVYNQHQVERFAARPGTGSVQRKRLRDGNPRGFFIQDRPEIVLSDQYTAGRSFVPHYP